MPEPLLFQQILTPAIAFLAIVISFVSLYRTSKLQRLQMRLHTKQAELTELQLQSLRKDAASADAQPQERADVRVDLEKVAKGSYRFVITNWGRVPARVVDFKLNKEKGKTSPLVRGDYDKKIPIPELAPGGRCPIYAAITMTSGTAFQASWSWRNPDDSEEQRASLLAI